MRHKESRNQLSAVTATGWDVMKCEGFTATATMKDVPLKMVVSRILRKLVCRSWYK